MCAESETVKLRFSLTGLQGDRTSHTFDTKGYVTLTAIKTKAAAPKLRERAI